MKYFLTSFLMCSLVASLAKAQFSDGLKCDLILKAQFKRAKIKICDKILDVEIAENDPQRSIGLMCRESLPENSGMIFIFSEERRLSFWMKNTKIPLSIAYLDKNKTLIDTYDMEPMSENPVLSKKPVLYALETNKGWFFKNKIKPGCKFEFIGDSSSILSTKNVTKGQ